MIYKVLLERGFRVAVDDHRVYPEHGREVASLQGIELRDYQKEAVAAGIEKGRGVFSLLPGMGKTEIMISLVASLKVRPVVWLTHTRELLSQTHSRFVQRLPGEIGIGKIGGGVWREKPITVCMVQTLARKENKERANRLLRGAQVLMLDEVHHTPARSWYKLAMECKAPFRFGCSATPLGRDDGSNLKLIGAVGDVIYELLPSQMRGVSVLATPSVYFIEYESTVRAGQSSVLRGDWQWLYRWGVTDHAGRNEAILAVCAKCIKEGRKTLVLVNHVNHGRVLDSMLTDWMKGSEHHQFIQGSDKPGDRREAIERFRSGELVLLISSPILDEGKDIPEVDALVLAGGGRSTIKNVQRIGRGLRTAGKDLWVFDFWDTCHRTLLAHSKKRKRDYKSLGIENVSLSKVSSVS